MSPISTPILLNLDLLIDYNSLLFSLIRSYFNFHEIYIKPEWKRKIEMKDNKEAFEIIRQILKSENIEIDNDNNLEVKFNEFFNKNLKSVRPQIYGCHFGRKNYNNCSLSSFSLNFSNVLY